MLPSASSLLRPLLLALLSAASLPASAAAAGTNCPHDDSGLKLPAGFCASVFADDIGHARHLVVSAAGVVYVNTWSGRYYGNAAPPSGGFLVALQDLHGDGVADVRQRFGETLQSGGAGGTGIGLYSGSLYAEINDKIVRYRLPAGATIPAGPPETIVSGLPLTGDHPMHPFAIDPDGALYVDVASATNSCQIKNRSAQSPGAEPCEELRTRGGIWRFDAGQTHQVFSSKQRFATGIRNGEGIAVDAAGRRLFVTQHGRDQLHANWPDLYPPEQEATLPAEEVLLLKKGGDYGWPECYYDPGRHRLVLAPEYGGDGGKAVGPCATKDEPVAAYPAHWAPNDLVFYDKPQFPAHYRKGLFIAFHGSWDRAPYTQSGYNVVFQPLAGDRAAGRCEVFADGFAGGMKSPGAAAHRPSGLAVGPDGALYVSDDVRGRIYRIVYQGPAQAGTDAPTVPCPDAAAEAGPIASVQDKPPEGTDPAAGTELPVPPGSTPASVALGQRLFHGEVAGASCTGCHGANGGGTPLGPSLTGNQWLWSDGGLEGIAATISQGVSQPKRYRAPMPAMGGAQLSAAQVSALAAYVWGLSHPVAAGAASAVRIVTIPGERIYPESITSTADGRLIIGSIGTRSIYSVAPGSVLAQPWIAPDSDPSLGVYGVLADERSGTLWACFAAVPGAKAADQSRSALQAFDLHTGKFEARYELPTAGAWCNDIALAPDGVIYVTDSNNMEIDRLQGRDQQLHLWAGDGDLGPKGGVLDGIAVVGNRVVVNTLLTGKLWSVAIDADGDAGHITDVNVDRPLEHPDGMRAFGENQLLLVEGGGGGRLDRVNFVDEAATVTTIKQGFPDGPVSVAVVGSMGYVLEGQLSALFGRSDPNTPVKPFRATAVELPR